MNLTFGDNPWEDYELTLQALKEGGAEGFLVLFRANDSDSFYWLNLGGWGNTRHAVEKENDGGRRTIGQGRSGRIETGRWYDVRVRCEGNHIQCWLDGEQIIDLRDGDNPYLKGMIGLGTWGTHARYRNIKASTLDGGEELFSGLPELPGKEFEVDFWTHYGSGRVEKVRDALNNEYSVRLTSSGLRPPIIRWPGGCFASVYLWKDAIGPQHERRIYSAYMWEDQDINSFGTDEYMRLGETVGVEPLLVINTGIYAGGLLNAYERQGRKFTLGGPALFLRHQSAGAWDNAFINFDHTGWFPAPNYVVMKLWWDNFAPKFLPVQGALQGCNIVVSRSENGDFVVVKAVNPKDQGTSVEVDLEGGFTPKTASMQMVAPGSLHARNTLDEPTAVHVQASAAQLNGQRVRFELPAYSAAVIRLK